ncbi:MAG: PRC-barrel domain-containing protein [Actinomycetota bacterium]|nr:PRC-barrel domain-containing protein [Actinomycetota bacterium]
MATTDLWTYRDTTIGTTDVTGYTVEAIDGSIGKIDEASNDVGASYIVVDTGPWIFGKKVLLPAGVVDRVDASDEVIYVNRTKDQIKDAPEFDESRYRDVEYRDEIGGYYGVGGPGYRDRA